MKTRRLVGMLEDCHFCNAQSLDENVVLLLQIIDNHFVSISRNLMKKPSTCFLNIVIGVPGPHQHRPRQLTKTLTLQLNQTTFHQRPVVMSVPQEIFSAHVRSRHLVGRLC